MERNFNKLVRDNIPKIIKNNGEEAIISILNDDEFKQELLKKLSEECNEVINSNNKKEMLEELGDVLEVIRSLSIICDSNFDEVINVSNKKRNMRGGFDKKIFLHKTIKKD